MLSKIKVELDCKTHCLVDKHTEFMDLPARFAPIGPHSATGDADSLLVRLDMEEHQAHHQISSSAVNL
jgi:hypothetical protein